MLSVLVFAILYVVSDLTLWADIAEPTFAIQAAITVSIGFALALVMGLIFTQIPLRRRDHFLLAWPVLFVIQWLTTMLEGFFFTTLLTEFLLLAGAIFGVLMSFFHAILIAILFPSYLHNSPLRTELRAYFSQYPSVSWLWRFA